MRKRRAPLLSFAALAVTVGMAGCGYEEFDMLSEYLSTHTEAMIADTATVFGCEAYLPVERAGDKEITSMYLNLFKEGEEEGYVPVMVLVDEVLEETISFNYGDKGREAYIAEVLSAERPDGKELFDKYYSELEQYYGDVLAANGGWGNPLLPFYSSGGQMLIPSGTLYDGELYIVKVPAENPYEIFAWLPFCGWNECPETKEMIAMCEYWYNEYGAVPAVITYDTLTFYLKEPVADEETAIKAAKEQCAFSSEILGYGGGLDAYIAMTLNKNIWSFWWD